MPNIPKLDDILAKKQELASKIASAEAMVEKLRSELQDFDAAVRVWVSLYGRPEEGAFQIEDNIPLPVKTPTKRKPSGIPQMPEMIIEAVESGIKMGAPGIDPAAMLKFVQGHYWPDATSPDVASAAWRMWKAGRLVKPYKDSPIYTLPGHNEMKPDPQLADQALESGVV